MEPLRQPVVLVGIEGDSVTLNGALIERVDDADPWIVGIQAVCSTVAAPLGRPVWALVSEPGGQTRLAVHPDATISHVEQVDPPPVVAAPSEAVAADMPALDVPDLAAPATPITEAEVPEPPNGELTAFLAHSARSQKQAPRRPEPERRHRGPGRQHPVVRRATPVLGVAALVTVALAAALLVTRGGGDEPQAGTESAAQGEVKDVLPAANRAKLRARFPRDLDVRVIPEAGSVELRVEASQLPVRAVIVLDPVNGSRVERRVTLRTTVTRLQLEALPAGSVDWTVRVAGARTATGSVKVPEAPTEAATTTSPTPTSQPEPSEPTSTAPSEPLTPIDPDEPTGPIDPDDL